MTNNQLHGRVDWITNRNEIVPGYFHMGEDITFVVQEMVEDVSSLTEREIMQLCLHYGFTTGEIS